MFCNDNNTKSTLAPAVDYRATGILKHLIQTAKRLLSVLINDTKWSKVTPADKTAEIKQYIKLIPNATTKITPNEAHFSRDLNTPISNITKKHHHKT